MKSFDVKRIQEKFKRSRLKSREVQEKLFDVKRIQEKFKRIRLMSREFKRIQENMK